MNGDMNGTMEEPMEMAPNSLTRAESNSKKPVTGSGNKPAEPIAASISSGDCCDKSSTPENNGVEQDPDNKQSVNISDGNTNANGESSQESDNDLQKTNDHDIKVPTEQSSNNLPQENQSNNSSDSNNETTLSSQDKQDKTKISQGEKSIESNHCKLDTVENEKSNDESEVESLKNHNNSSDSNAESTRTQDEQESSDKSLSEKTKDIKEKLLENDAEIELSEDDYEDESSEEDGVIVPGRQKIEDTVSINSDSESEDDETSRESQNQIDEVVILDNDTPEKRNGTRGSHTPEVHEIVSDNDDDCVVTEETTVENGSRRSSRNLKRKCYASSENGEESDIEEVLVEDPLNETKSKNSVKTKRSKLNKKKPSLLIVDTDTILSGKSTVPSKSTSTGANTQSLYQSIAARGTTVTPIVAKPPPAPVAPPPPILPSLTDDMFVVEAPSFIVPYVYEKPSTEPFRKFVDALGKEIEEKKAEEEKERLEKAKEEKEKKEKEKQERRDRGEEVVDSEPEVDEKATEKKARRRRKNPEDDDRSWDGSKEDSDESLSDVESIEEKEDSVAKTTVPTPVKTDSYFECSLGKFFINIGLNLVTEYVQNDLLKLQNRKLNREKKSGQKTKATATAIASLTKNLEFSKENNAPYAFTMTKCEFCTFKTESALVMKHHLETPHMKNNLYTCNFCEFEIKSPHEILTHMETKHNVRGRLERALSYHQCANCPFEDNGKGKLARHLVACAKKYKAEVNLAPPFEWEPPAKIPKITRPRNNNSVSGYQTAFNRAAMGTHLTRPIAVQNLMPSYRPRCRLPATAANSPRASMPPAMRPNLVRQNSPSGVVANNAAQGKSATKTSGPSLSITPLPRAPLPAAAAPTTKGTFVICEICDGYIKDLEQLRNHMQWIHKVKIHPKMIYNRPPLNCQKCQFRFFTDQGLERHLLGSHGLVTSSMQEAANKGRDAGRCPVCGRVYQSWLLKHVARDHNLTLKPAHLSYKCTVCTATFGMYKQFEHHVYSAHRVVAKRVMDKSKAAPVPKPAPAAADAKPRPVKISNEITVTPQPAKASTSAKGK